MTHFLERIIFGYIQPYRKQAWLLFLCILTLVDQIVVVNGSNNTQKNATANDRDDAP